MIRPYFGSHFVLKRPAPEEPTRTKFNLGEILGKYDAKQEPGGGYSEITSVLDENDAIVKEYLHRSNIEYEITASAEDHFTAAYKQDKPDWSDAQARNMAKSYISYVKGDGDYMKHLQGDI